MTVRATMLRILQQEDINFLLTNRIPRRLLTRLMGWFSKIEQPLVRDVSIRLWRLFSDLDLSEARDTEFKSMHACFTRALKAGARPVDADPDVVASPCDAIVGAHGRIAGTELLQVKGFPYRLEDLLGSSDLVARHRDGHYVTLRLTASMYHRFHAPYDCRVERVTYISGDTWNVNPIALARIERLFCRNERAVIETRLAGRRRAHAGAGRRDPGGVHPAALPAGAAEPCVSRCERPPLRGRLPQRRRDGMVRARIDHRDAGAGFVVVRRQRPTGDDHPPGQPLMRLAPARVSGGRTTAA